MSSIGAGVIFLVLFAISLHRIDPNWYQYRDDGIVTLSAAKNWIEFGFIGLNPSGPIIEAFSAPVQFFLYTLSYALARPSYVTFTQCQTWLCTFVLGFLFIRFFDEKDLKSWIVSALTAGGLAFFYPFLEWQASGLENGITHVLFLLALLVLYRLYMRGRVVYWQSLLIFLATISRIDSIVHIAPVLLIFVLLWSARYRNTQGLHFAGLVGGLWLAFQTARFLYFGQLLPNTAYAQHIDVLARLGALFTLKQPILLSSLQTTSLLMRRLGIFLLIPLVPLAPFVRLDRDRQFVALGALSLVNSALATAFLFGRARIDPVRLTTDATLFVFVLISLCLYSSPSILSLSRRLAWTLSAVVLLYALAGPRPYYLGWSTTGMAAIQAKLKMIATTEDLHRPTVSTPDLGLLTWRKEFNDVDLGRLGDPVLAHLGPDRLVADYLINYSRPDLIEAHNGWVLRYYYSIFGTPAFLNAYEQLHLQPNPSASQEERQPAALECIWIRKDILRGSGSAERSFLNALQDGLSVDRIAQEVAGCRGGWQQCGYIARTVYRFLPEIRSRGMFPAVYRLFHDPIAQAVLRGWRDPQAYRVILRCLRSDSSGTTYKHPGPQ